MNNIINKYTLIYFSLIKNSNSLCKFILFKTNMNFKISHVIVIYNFFLHLKFFPYIRIQKSNL